MKPSDRFAAGTTVSPEKTRMEIETVLARYGAESFAYATMPGRARIEFVLAGRRIRFDVRLPSRDEKRFTQHPKRTWRSRSEAAAGSAYDAEIRRLWRALLLAIKAKLELTASGITTLETEFMAHIVLPDGRTVGEHALPAIAAAYETGQVRGLLPETT